VAWITGREAEQRYRVKRITLVRAIENGRLPVVIRRGRDGRLWRLIDEEALRAYFTQRRLGIFGRRQRLLSWTGEVLPPMLLVPEVAELEGVAISTVGAAIKSGKLAAEKNEANVWIIAPDSVRLWRAALQQSGRGRPRVGMPDPLWAFPPTPDEIDLLREFIYVGLLAQQMSRRQGIDLEPMWSGKLVHAIHEREKLAFRTAVGVVG